MLTLACAAIISVVSAFLLARDGPSDRVLWVPFLLLAFLLACCSVPGDAFDSQGPVQCVVASLLPLSLCLAAWHYGPEGSRALFGALSAMLACMTLYISLDVCHAKPSAGLQQGYWRVCFCALGLVAAFFAICAASVPSFAFAFAALCIAAAGAEGDCFPVFAAVGPLVALVAIKFVCKC